MTMNLRKLHLGCGGVYLDGYINVDISSEGKCDVCGDLRELVFEDGQYDEIRLHHIFEHFQRHEAIWEMCRWNRALVDGGMLKIEVPDVESTIKEWIRPSTNVHRKRELIRHLWGSHKAKWATHQEGYTSKNLMDVFQVCGFAIDRIIGGGDRWADFTMVGHKIEKPSLNGILMYLSDFDAGLGTLMPFYEKYFKEKFNG